MRAELVQANAARELLAKQHAALKARSDPPPDLQGLDSAELLQRLEETAKDHRVAAQAGHWARATELSRLQGHLTAAVRDAQEALARSQA